MGDRSNIGWTEATWNPVTGCSRVSRGCEHCYAETLSLRRGWTTKPWTKQNAAENVRVHEGRLRTPLSWRKPRMVFVNSMSDLFHERVPDEFIARVFAVMGMQNIHSNVRHTYQVLTKRPERMRQVVQALDPKKLVELALEEGVGMWGPLLVSRVEFWKEQNRPFIEQDFSRWPLPNVWLGVSVEDQRRADERVPMLMETPAAVRWVSAEPLLGPIGFSIEGFGTPESWLTDDGRKLDWVVAGGESGPGHRPMDVKWLESIACDCHEARVPLFVKQDSGARPGKQGRIPDELWALKQFPAVAS